MKEPVRVISKKRWVRGRRFKQPLCKRPSEVRSQRPEGHTSQSQRHCRCWFELFAACLEAKPRSAPR